MKNIRYTLQDGIATITFDEPDSPVNTMSLQWQDDMDEVGQQVLKDKDAIQGIIPILELEKFSDLKSGHMTQKIKQQIEHRIGLQTL